KKLVEALKRPEKGLPEPSAREKRQLMADVKLLEPDAYGTRAAVEGVVLGGQSMVGATVEKVQEAGFRTKQQIERGEGEPGPRRLDPKTGELTEVSAEDEVGRRRAEAHGNVGSNRVGDQNLSAYEKNAKRLQVAEAVLGHLLGHLPGPGDAGPKDTSAAAKNLNRIVVAAGEMGVRGKSTGLGHLSDIVAAKGAKDPIPAIHQALASWAGESSVQGWAATNGFPLTTDAGRVAAFAGWSREQAMSLTGRMRIATETGGLYGDVAVGTGRTPGPAAPAPAEGGPPPPSGGVPARPLPSGEAPLTTGEHDAAPANPTGTAAPGAGTPAAGAGAPGAGTGKPGDVVPTNQELDTAFGHLESGTGPKREPTNMYAVDANALTDARFTQTGGSELDVRNIAKVGVQDQAGTTTPGQKPPETWLVDPTRAGITDPKVAADTDFRPNQGKKGAFDVRNAQVVAGPQGDGVRTPTGPTFGDDHVVGGARGATLDPATGTWVAGSAPYERTPNKLGQDGTFTPKTQDEWQAWEQTLGKLPEEQRYALWFYGDDLSSPLNHGLRGQKANQFVTDPIARQAAASQLDQAMRPIPFDTEVHRKASIRDFSDLKVSDPAELAGMVGKQYAHQGYTSTAIVTGTWSGDIDIVIQVPKGTRGRYLAGAPGAEPTNPLKPAAGAPLASMPGEMEFLIERGTTFTIQKATQDPSSGRWTIEVRVAEQGTKAKPLTSPVPLPGTPKNP
ncbi:MAG TPA: ADP-ribosyltransferase, partial [Candidatus Limnocylindrales bacterium]|nr:ADP-ribosyltransferase [Candidatus Limnocylindrales bacterium]